MGFFSRFPYTDFHRLNADWILDKIEEMMGITQEAAETVETYDDRLTAVETAAAGAVRFDSTQSLTSSQQQKARNNIDAASAGGLTTLSETVWGIESTVERCVRTDIQQSFNSSEQAMARDNIGAASQVDLNNLDQALDYCVQVVDQTNDFTAAQRTQARRNIGAASSSTVDDLDQAVAGLAEDLNNAVLYTSQQLTSAQQAQARNNIGAASSDAALAGAVLYNQNQSLTSQEQTRARTNIEALHSVNAVAYGSLGLMDDSVAGNDGDQVDATLTSTANHSILRLEGDQSNTVRLAGLAAPDEDDEAVTLGFADVTYEQKWETRAVTGATPSITPADHVIFEAGTVTSLTVSTPLAEEFVLIFDSGSTAATLSLPAAVNMPSDFQVNANTHYEISIRKTWGLYAAWEVTP